MVSTHFRQPQQVPERDQRLLDCTHVSPPTSLRVFGPKKHSRKPTGARTTSWRHWPRTAQSSGSDPQCHGTAAAPDSDVALIEWGRSMMERQLAQIVRLIDDLLDISRITRGKLQLRIERVELAAMIRNAIEGRTHSFRIGPTNSPLAFHLIRSIWTPIRPE